MGTLSWLLFVLAGACSAVPSQGDIPSQGLFLTTLALNILLAGFLMFSWLAFVKIRRRDSQLQSRHAALLREHEQLSSQLESIQAKKNTSAKGSQEQDVPEKDHSVPILPRRPNQLNAEHISHVWVEGNYIYYKHKDEPKYILKRDRLKNVYLRLQKHHFVQTHKSYLVNMAMIKQVSWKEISLTDGSKIPLSRKHKEGFRDAYQAFHERQL